MLNIISSQNHSLRCTAPTLVVQNYNFVFGIDMRSSIFIHRHWLMSISRNTYSNIITWLSPLLFEMHKKKTATYWLAILCKYKPYYHTHLHLKQLPMEFELNDVLVDVGLEQVYTWWSSLLDTWLVDEDTNDAFSSSSSWIIFTAGATTDKQHWNDDCVTVSAASVDIKDDRICVIVTIFMMM